MKKFLILSISLFGYNSISADGFQQIITHPDNTYLTNNNQDGHLVYGGRRFLLSQSCHTDCKPNLCPWTALMYDRQCPSGAADTPITYATIPSNTQVICQPQIGDETRAKIYDCLVNEHGSVKSFNLD
ncbi:hypothetical protein A3F66_05660 [candidate division TM6 bacterium RIFCSPHIGHO2_12_FULL_32_22]|nr:MAG: hypothetical protein A3F66_05660 [candidate division TM6 bacterium RIFCSPHIGHO2_12_FULL_32_22]